MKFVIQGVTRLQNSNLHFLLYILQAKMAHQGKQMRVGARGGFAYQSVRLVLLANGDRYEVDPNTFFFFKW
jgi:hypothetical protein